MDDSEELAFQYLTSLGYTDIKYEPDGNIPPDFLINGRIAVEVRRLNKQIASENGYEGIEKKTYPLVAWLQNLLNRISPNNHSESWYVHFSFERPIPNRSAIEQHITEHLTEFSNLEHKKFFEFELNDNFEYCITKASTIHETFFVLGCYIDHDRGGWLLGDILESARNCIKEKSQKTAKFRQKYPEWWLVMPNYISPTHLSDEDKNQLRQNLNLPHDWDKIIIINPSAPRSGFELT